MRHLQRNYPDAMPEVVAVEHKGRKALASVKRKRAGTSKGSTILAVYTLAAATVPKGIDSAARFAAGADHGGHSEHRTGMRRRHFSGSCLMQSLEAERSERRQVTINRAALPIPHQLDVSHFSPIDGCSSALSDTRRLRMMLDNVTSALLASQSQNLLRTVSRSRSFTAVHASPLFLHSSWRYFGDGLPVRNASLPLRSVPTCRSRTEECS
jgi:hypothetical protein